ncbi:MAG: UvrD-helicase domain-containing protein, partial [Lachnospiraceae bacterium]|nr:UvrD-helicase domain-containing protein [Lachnospiraceae bacterium]
ISSCKNELIGAEEYAGKVSANPSERMKAAVYREYQARLRSNNAMDFDDLIVNTVQLLRQDPEVQHYYQDRLWYLMVDEYQDTNSAQFELIRLLAGGRQNLCVVGDDDQSIYKFRGANIYNILNFERYFPEATVIRLEQNYRSKGHILDAANAVIANNKGRKEKKLWTQKDAGGPVRFRQFDSAYEEAAFIAGDIKKMERALKADYKDCAVLYRTNAQSRILEEKFMMENIPYKIVGGVNFYQRKEIKDILAYLKAIDNVQDDVAVRRILNVPKRGIGATTEAKVAEYALEKGVSFYEGLECAGENPSLARAAKKIAEFVRFMEVLSTKLAFDGLTGLVKDVLDGTGYYNELLAEGTDEAKARIENLDEFISKTSDFESRFRQEKEKAGEEWDPREMLSGFLEEVGLIADIDSVDENDNYVVLMTLHSAKGLEFPYVYLSGLEDGLFPSFMSISAEDGGEEIEEERRLMYVGITRAMESLTITAAKARMVRGETQYSAVSRFVKEIPQELLDGSLPTYKKSESFDPFTYSGGGSGYGSVAYGGVRGYGGGAQAMRSRKQPKESSAASYKKKLDALVKKGGEEKAQGLSYAEGDRVKHKKFGEGVVQKIVDGGRDYEVTVAFDTAGVRKMFAAFAKLEKV